MSERDDNKPDDAPTSAEVAAAARLRDALDEDAAAATPDAALALALRAAWSPESLDDHTHAEVVEDAPLSAEEIAEAEALAKTLGTVDEPSFVTALRVAHAPTDLAEAEHTALVERALGRPKSNVLAIGRIRRAAVVVATTFAAAAAVTLWFSTPAETAVPLARTRSTAPLFVEPFGEGNASARIDRIAVARAADYRDNRFAQWGVR